MQVAVVLFAEDDPLPTEIDGITYYTPAVDADRHVQVDVLSSALATPPTTPKSGQETVTTAGTAVQLAAQACKSVSVKALAGNTGKIYVGDSSVSSADGYELSPGEPIDMAIDNVNRLYIDAAVDGEGVCWLAVN